MGGAFPNEVFASQPALYVLGYLRQILGIWVVLWIVLPLEPLFIVPRLARGYLASADGRPSVVKFRFGPRYLRLFLCRLTEESVG